MLAETALLFHNYYGNHEKWINHFISNNYLLKNVFYNVVYNSHYNINDIANASKCNILKEKYVDINFRYSQNIGKDIGGKLLLIDSYLRMEKDCKYIVFLHDKESPYHFNGLKWKNSLLSVSNEEFIERAIKKFKSNSDIGIITANGNIAKESEESRYRSSDILDHIQQQYELKIPSFNYVAGTMFIVKSECLQNFYIKNNPLKIREGLESGNVLDEKNTTNTHLWERMFSWIPLSMGYSLISI